MCIIPHDGDFDFSDSEIKAETGERRVPDLCIQASYVALPGAKSAPKFHTQVCNRNYTALAEIMHRKLQISPSF